MFILSYWVLPLLFIFQLLAPQYKYKKAGYSLSEQACFFIFMLYITNENLIFLTVTTAVVKINIYLYAIQRARHFLSINALLLK